LVLGFLLSFTSFIISFYTCTLIIWTAKNDADYIFTLKKYYGKVGLYIGMIGPTILLIGAMTVYFSVLVSSFYPLIYTLFHDVFEITSMRYIDPVEGPPFFNF